ncbi:MAG TPA: class I SAM-dependent methyltransferase [Bryobacteraceae bacterium]|nr:class I SAM-dependent methyltransferase [Bryobacteraceae bacterium]
MSKRPDYGIDAPGVLAMFFVAGALCLVFGVFARPIVICAVTIDFDHAPQITGGIFLLEGVLMFIYVKWGKFRHRDRMLAQVSWTGNESVLDVGTGRGLLLIGAARHLTTGRAVGIDIWSAKDLSGNAIERTQANIEMEGVGGKVELRTEDASQMTFPDSSFDVVVSNLCIHNIPKQAGRDQACREIARVLRPEGVAVISDYKLTKKYAGAFAGLGFAVEWRGPFWRDTFPPLKMFVARKPL